MCPQCAWHMLGLFQGNLEEPRVFRGSGGALLLSDAQKVPHYFIITFISLTHSHKSTVQTYH